jgi:uncharacterized protein with HEPN domain
VISELDRDRLAHMVVYGNHAIDILGDADAATLQCDIKTQLAVRHAVEIVGEAAAKVSEAGRAALPQVPWKSIVGMRNTLIHGYANVDLDQVVVVVRRDLPPLIVAIERLLEGDAE